MAAEVDREQAIAGREAMRRLSGDVTLVGCARRLTSCTVRGMRPAATAIPPSR